MFPKTGNDFFLKKRHPLVFSYLLIIEEQKKRIYIRGRIEERRLVYIFIFFNNEIVPFLLILPLLYIFYFYPIQFEM
jgi:hypothetical protein